MTHNGQSATADQREVAAIIARCLGGDQPAYTQLYECFAAGVYRLCYSLVLNHEDAEDVTQESFVYAFRNLHRYDPARASFKTWLYTIAVSRSRNVHRRRQLTQIDLAQIFQRFTEPQSPTPEAALAHRAAADALASALAALPGSMREAVALRYGHGLTYREIAEVMNCPPKTAESRIRLAHRHLRGLLQPAGSGLLEELLSF